MGGWWSVPCSYKGRAWAYVGAGEIWLCDCSQAQHKALLECHRTGRITPWAEKPGEGLVLLHTARGSWKTKVCPVMTLLAFYGPQSWFLVMSQGLGSDQTCCWSVSSVMLDSSRKYCAFFVFFPALNYNNCLCSTSSNINYWIGKQIVFTEQHL